jgi:hypothetical protein
MSLFDSASICITPNGVKEGKLYSIKPTDGSGDLSVTRATTATRVNSAGLVEVVPYNFLFNSQDFSTWNLEGGTMTSGQLDPLGGNTAYKYDPASGGLWSNSVLNENQTQVTYSFWAKSVYGGNLNMVLADGGGFNTYGTISIDGTWKYYTFTLDRTTPSAGGMYLYGISNSEGFYIWQPQINIGTSAKDYYPTTTRLNIPRLDYTNGSCPSILVEPQRTNLLTYSEDFSDASWSKDNIVVTSNNTISPNGIANAELFTQSTNINNNQVRKDVTVSLNTYTLSCFFKKGTGDIAKLQIYNDTIGATLANANYNLTNKTATLLNGTGTVSIQEFNNGWFRCVLSIPQTSGYLLNWCGFNFTSGQTGYIWGAQLEAGSYPTSYIPTTSASVTRNADVISKTGISSLIGQTEGTMFLDIDFTHNNKGENEYLAQIWQDGSNRILFYRMTNGKIAAILIRSASIIYNFESLINANGKHKIALAYKSGNIVFYIDGVAVNSSTSTFTAFSSMSNYDLGIHTASGSPSEIGDYPYQSAVLWKTALSNDQLAQLTTI